MAEVERFEDDGNIVAHVDYDRTVALLAERARAAEEATKSVVMAGVRLDSKPESKPMLFISTPSTTLNITSSVQQAEAFQLKPAFQCPTIGRIVHYVWDGFGTDVPVGAHLPAIVSAVKNFDGVCQVSLHVFVPGSVSLAWRNDVEWSKVVPGDNHLNTWHWPENA